MCGREPHIGENGKASTHARIVLQRRKAMCFRERPQRIWLAVLGRFGQDGEMVLHVFAAARFLDSAHGGKRLNGRFHRTARFGDDEETRRAQIAFCEQRIHRRCIEIVEKPDARPALQQGCGRRAPAGELRKRLRPEGRTSRPENEQIARILHQCVGDVLQRGDVVPALGHAQERQAAGLISLTQPGERFFRPGQPRLERGRGHACSADFGVETGVDGLLVVRTGHAQLTADWEQARRNPASQSLARRPSRNQPRCLHGLQRMDQFNPPRSP